MKLLLFTFFLLCSLLQVAIALQTHKAVVITFPQDTPDSVVDDAKKTITDGGGWVTHEYHLIKGFAAKASANALKSVSTLSTTFLPVIEEDKVVSTDGGFVGDSNDF